MNELGHAAWQMFDQNPCELVTWLKARILAGEDPGEVLDLCMAYGIHPLSICMVGVTGYGDYASTAECNKIMWKSLDGDPKWLKHIGGDGLRIKNGACPDLAAGLVLTRLELYRLSGPVHVPEDAHISYLQIYRCAGLTRLSAPKGIKGLELFELDELRELSPVDGLEYLRMATCGMVASRPTFQELMEAIEKVA